MYVSCSWKIWKIRMVRINWSHCWTCPKWCFCHPGIAQFYLLKKLCVYETDKSSKKASNGAITDSRIATIIGDKNIFLNPDGRAKQQGIGLSGFYTGTDTIKPVWKPKSSPTKPYKATRWSMKNLPKHLRRFQKIEMHFINFQWHRNVCQTPQY